MAKAVAVKKDAHTHKKAAPEAEQTTIQLGQDNSPVGKAPENTDDLPVNYVGQKIDKPITEKNDAYLTPDNKTMIVQMEEADQVFAGEYGKNAQWFPKEVVKTWTKKN